MRPLALVLLLASCSPEASPALVVFAASSMTDVSAELARAYEEETGVPVVVSIGASSTLAHQIAQGAPADVVLLAGSRWGGWLRDGGLVEEPRTVARGALVAVVPTRSDAPDGPLAVSGARRIALADPAHVPAGQYARHSLERGGLWRNVEARIVPFPNVRAALGAVASGRADVAVVYASDTRVTDRVRVAWRLPETEPVQFVCAPVQGQNANGSSFCSFTARQRSLWRDAGFLPTDGAR